MVCLRKLESYVGDLDLICSYSTSRTLLIRDKRLGITLYSIQGAILFYVVVWQLILSQVYMADSNFASVVRLQLQQPNQFYRWPSGKGPFCLGTSAIPSDYPTASHYTIPSEGYYSYLGSALPQRHCQFFDETGAVPIPETDRMFVTTETRQTNQNVQEGTECTTVGSINCTFLPSYSRNDDNITRRSFVADIEYFTLLIDHSMSAPLAGITRTVSQMEGSLLDKKGHIMDPCDDYLGFAMGCPTNETSGFDVALGRAGLPDIVPLATLLRAAGVTSLDLNAGLNGRDAEETLREAGIVLNLEISYTNFFFSLGRGPLPWVMVPLTTARSSTATLSPL